MTRNQALEQYLQKKVNEVAKMLIKVDPETAENNPKQIGKMAKMMVFDAMNQAIDELGTS